jgi:hypothetical protein
MPTFKTALAGMLLMVAGTAMGAIGDNAPPIPATWKSQHPRLPFPDNGFVSSLASNPTALAAYNATADAWNSTNPSGTWQFRRLLIAYLANKTVNPSKAAAYMEKIKALADLGGSWGKLLVSANDAVGNGSYKLTSASANFLTGCDGASCANQILTINARQYLISSVIDAHTVMLNNANAPPSGSGLPIRVFSYLNAADINIALVYDWLYNDLDTATRNAFLSQLETLCTIWEENYIGLNASPYNDVFYIRNGPSGIMMAIALYPDHPKGAQHLRFMTDIWFSVLMPVWKQVFGPEGGGWHENWSDYVRAANGFGLTSFIVPSLLSWQSASGEPIFTRESWLKNFAYFTMYTTRPDYLTLATGDASRAYMVSESPGLGSLNGLAEIYDDPILRGWARFVNAQGAVPDGFEPSAFPFYTPDKPSNPVATRDSLPTTRNFTGWGMMTMRTGWSEDDTYATLKYGDNFWSHEHFDAGSFTLFNRGLLALDSGSYRAGSLSKHQNQYARQTIAHNTLTITDPADDYPNTKFLTYDENGGTLDMAPPNDGGQRRVGTLYNQRFPQFVSPNNIGDWMRNWDYYHTGTMVGFADTPAYTWTAVDITNAYNNKYSATQPNASNRTYRVQKAIRNMVFIPRGTSAYVVIFDQVTSTNASFVKRWILHSVNQPVITGNRFEITRNELVTSMPYGDMWPYRVRNFLKYTAGSTPNLKYKFDGKLYGWSVSPQATVLTPVGGPGKEFWIEDPKNPGTGTNWNQCMSGQCSANTEGLGSVENFINPVATTAPHEPGSWRLEIKPAAPATDDYFLNVMLTTTVGDKSIPANVTVPAGLPDGSVGATWTEGGRTYTLVFPKNGVGGRITISGVIDEDLTARSQQLPASVQMASGSGQAGVAGTALPNPLTVVVKDASGNPVPNAVVHWAVTQGTGYVSTTMATADAQGRASAILIPTGATGSTVRVMANVNGIAPVEFTASVNNSGAVSPAVQGLSCTPAAIAAGAASTCTITLSSPAAPGGTSVALSPDNPDVTTSPAIVVPAGSSSVSFTATAAASASSRTANITAAAGGGSATFALSVTALQVPAPPAVAGLSCVPASIPSGASSNCSVTLGQPAPAGGVTVQLSAASAALVVPASVPIAQGATSAQFTATAGSVASALNVALTASGTAGSKSFTLAVTPPAAAAVSALVCSPDTLQAGSSATCTVTLTQAVSSVASVAISSTSTVLGVPDSVTVEANGSSASFSATAGTFTTSTTASVSAAFGGTAKTASVSLVVASSGGIPIGTKKWVMVPTRGLPVQTVGYEKLVYAGAPLKRAAMLGNYHSLGTEPNQAITTYDFDTNSWNVLDIGASFRTENMPEAGHPVGGFAWDPNGRQFLYYCCASGSNQAENIYGMWSFDPIGMTGRSRQTASRPGGIQYHTSAFDPTNNAYVLHGGGSFVGTWIYDPGANTFRQVTPSGTAPNPSVNQAAMTWNSDDGRTWLFGGQIGSGFSNDLFAYNVTTNTWTKIEPKGTKPSPRWRSAIAYDSVNNIFMMYGGQDDTTVYNDTWIFDPAANTWTQFATSTVPPSDSVAAFETLAYDSDHNAFILVLRGNNGYADGPSGRHATQTWMFRYDGPGPNPGNLSYTAPQPSPDSLNLTAQGWAKEPVLATSGNTTYAAWVETGGIFDATTNDAWFHVVVKSKTGSGPWKKLGSGAQALDSEFSGYTESHSPSISVVGGTPWVTWYKWNNSGQLWALWAKSWNGSSWQGGPVGLVGSDPLRSYQGRSQVIDVGGVPHIAFLEVDKSFFPQKTFVYVKYWDGKQWALKGTGALNVNGGSTITTAGSVSITTDGSAVYVAWTEFKVDALLKNPTPAQVYVSRWNGSQWIPSSSLNTSAAGWAEDVSMAMSGGVPHVAWTERTVTGPAQLFVKSLNGNAWTLVGSGALNRNTATGYAFRPALADGGSGVLYAAWVEQPAPGQTAQTRVAKWHGGWSPLGDSLNASAAGSAQRAAIGVVEGQPVVAWGELQAGGLRQIYARSWSGSAWSNQASAPETNEPGTNEPGTNPPPTSPVSSPCDVNNDGVVSAVDVQMAVDQALGRAACTTGDVQKNGICNAVDVQRVIAVTLGGACVVQ